MKRAIIIISSILTLLISCSNQPSQPGKDSPGKQRTKQRTKAAKQLLSLNIFSEPQTLDPRKVRSIVDSNLTQTFMEGLMRINKEGVTAPALTTHYKISDDGLTYTFTLRESQWSNGDPLTAYDFVYAWKKTLSPDFLADNAFLLYVIKNGRYVKEGVLPSTMLGIRAENDQTIVVELEYKTPFFLELLSLPSFFPVNNRIDRETANWALNANTYVCNGPFKMVEWKHSDQIIAEKNPYYWDKDAVKLQKIQMVMVDCDTALLMFQKGELDWEGSPYSQLPIDALASLKSENLVHIDPFLGTVWIRTNTSLFPLHNENIRKALALSLDRQEIVTHVIQGGQLPATGIVPASFGLQDEPYFADASYEEASSLLGTGLNEESLTLENFPEITLSYVGDTRNHRLAQTVQNQWLKALGIRIRLEPLEHKIYFDRISKGDYQLATGSWTADFRDPINFLEIFKSKHIGTNNTNWESLDYMKAIEESYLSVTGEERMDALKRSEKIIMDQMPVIPIFHHSLIHVQNSHLKDVVLTDSGHIDFKWSFFE